MTNARSEAVPHPKSGIRANWVNHALCILLCLVFLTAAIAKTQSFREFEATLIASKLVPVLLASRAGIMVLVTECLLSVLLLVPTTRRPALYAATILVSVFAAYSTWRWIQGIAVPCHCFGALLKLEPWQSLLLDVILLGVISTALTINPLFQPDAVITQGEME